MHLSNLSLTPEGVGSTWETWRAFGLRLHAAWTRAEYIPNRRIVDRVSSGVTWTSTTEQGPKRHHLVLGLRDQHEAALANNVLNRVFSRQARQLERMLANYRSAIQA